VAQKIERLNMMFIVGTVTLIVGFVVANIALFQWLECIGMQSLLGDSARYVFGLAGFAAIVLGAVMMRDAWILRNVLKGKYKQPPSPNNLRNTRIRQLNPMLPTEIVDRKTVVMKSRLNLDMVQWLAERLKRDLFVKMRFLKPKSVDVRVVSIDKQYEPYIIVGGKYSIDYYKKRVFPVQVDGDATEIALLGEKFKPKPLKNRPQSSHGKIELRGEALYHYEDETYTVIDKMGRELAPEQIPIAPSEELSPEKLVELGIEASNVQISSEEEIDFLRSKIVRRPPDGEVTKEIFEVNDRTLAYSPIYQLVFEHLKTGKRATVKIDGITGEIIRDKKHARPSTTTVEKPLTPVRTIGPPTFADRSIEDKTNLPETIAATSCVDEQREPTSNLGKPTVGRFPLLQTAGVERTLAFQAKVDGEIFHAGDNITVVGDLEIPPKTTVYKTLMVKGTLRIGTECKLLSKIEALKDVTIGANTEIEGNVVAGGDIVVGPDAFIHGSVKSAGFIEIGENAVIEGRLHSKSSVVLNRFAQVHGRARS
jgi:cytoskeletal protein CcmA (bactofilin family)